MIFERLSGPSKTLFISRTHVLEALVERQELGDPDRALDALVGTGGFTARVMVLAPAESAKALQHLAPEAYWFVNFNDFRKAIAELEVSATKDALRLDLLLVVCALGSKSPTDMMGLRTANAVWSFQFNRLIRSSLTWPFSGRACLNCCNLQAMQGMQPGAELLLETADRLHSAGMVNLPGVSLPTDLEIAMALYEATLFADLIARGHPLGTSRLRHLEITDLTNGSKSEHILPVHPGCKHEHH